MNEYALLRKQYPSVLCVDQARQILHVSKRKMVWMLEHGYVSYTDSGKKTRQYRIELESLIAYIKASRRHPDRYPIPAVFTSGCKSTQKPQTYILRPGEIPPDFGRWLDDEWYRVSDMLTANDIANLLGYDHNTVRRWLAEGKIERIIAQGDEYIAKQWVIDFTATTAFGIQRKSEKHIELIKRYYNA